VQSLHAIKSWLTEINPTVGASLIALVGIVVSLWWNRVQQRRQQFLELRREIYLGAAEAFGAATEFLAGIAQPEVTRAHGAKLVESLSRGTAKIHVVGTQEVLSAVDRLLQEYMRRYFALILEKDEADELSRNIGDYQAAIKGHYELLERRELDHSEILHRIQGLDTAEAITSHNLYKLQWKMIHHWMECPPALAPLEAQVVLAIKRELGIKIQAQWYRAASSARAAGVVEMVRAYLEASKQRREEKAKTRPTRPHQIPHPPSPPRN
jgi:hypothetical protein